MHFSFPSQLPHTSPPHGPSQLHPNNVPYYITNRKQVAIIYSENVLSLHDVSLFILSLQLSLPPQYSHNFVSVHIVSIIFPLHTMPPQFSLRAQFSHKLYPCTSCSQYTTSEQYPRNHLPPEQLV
jgi:hypothetical protein